MRVCMCVMCDCDRFDKIYNITNVCVEVFLCPPVSSVVDNCLLQTYAYMFHIIIHTPPPLRRRPMIDSQQFRCARPPTPPQYHRNAHYNNTSLLSCPPHLHSRCALLSSSVVVVYVVVYAANGSNRVPATSALRKFVHTSRSFCERAIRKRHVNSTTSSLVIWCR